MLHYADDLTSDLEPCLLVSRRVVVYVVVLCARL